MRSLAIPFARMTAIALRRSAAGHRPSSGIIARRGHNDRNERRSASGQPSKPVTPSRRLRVSQQEQQAIVIGEQHARVFDAQRAARCKESLVFSSACRSVNRLATTRGLELPGRTGPRSTDRHSSPCLSEPRRCDPSAGAGRSTHALETILATRHQPPSRSMRGFGPNKEQGSPSTTRIGHLTVQADADPYRMPVSITR